MANVSLKKLDINDSADQLFTYDVIKYRWENASLINIKHKTQKQVPTFDEHLKVLLSDRYKQIYKIFLAEFLIGMIYIDKNNVNGTFLLPPLLKKAFKELKKRNENFDIKSITPQTHIQLFKNHPDVTVHFATVNPNNILSLRALIENGYEHIETVLAIKTENGEVKQGPWKI
jgi:hypothetical protein